MSKIAGTAGGRAMAALGGVAVAVVIAAGLVLSGVVPDLRPDGGDQEAAVPSVPSETAIQTDESGESGEAAQTSGTDAVATPDMPAPPEISLFRLEPDGSALVAGRATEGWRTTIMLDGAELADATLGAGGEFAEFVTLAPSDTPRILALRMSREGEESEILSREEVIVAPTPPEIEPVASEEEAPPRDRAEPGAHDIAGEESEAAEVQAAEVGTGTVEDEAEGEAELVTDATKRAGQTVLMADEDGVEVLQPAGAPQVLSQVALDAITYDAQGEVQLAGRGQGGAFVRVYLDNTPITTSRIAADGRWRSDLPEVDTGVYTLRIDEVTDEGRVTSRVETPFKREDEAVIAEAEARAEAAGVEPGGTRVDVVTVQPGSTLWAISRDRYGEGILYVRVFEANRDRIRDPDLIYPGQVFSLPE
ncbi:LysM peptidoglycan-binding domain-containing protein [Roseovarius sp. SCSIO 43702]|uniref:LysM peptidoglycan-binding domain-containing protein n=1 Tax=Roseovarius sp. SCSIO 43702 TaxID=2823043 RepID=UPI001C734E4A|nr:LysM peptidoglycan-binding domain-containing protein [Roseovarius sp. SCSIO 43702]QYX56414.1 LysM peptidoglycan-binding domain-containing protein [Roseovarius sp. SCSIO 43702]